MRTGWRPSPRQRERLNRRIVELSRRRLGLDFPHAERSRACTADLPEPPPRKVYSLKRQNIASCFAALSSFWTGIAADLAAIMSKIGGSCAPRNCYFPFG